MDVILLISSYSFLVKIKLGLRLSSRKKIISKLFEVAYISCHLDDYALPREKNASRHKTIF